MKTLYRQFPTDLLFFLLTIPTLVFMTGCEADATIRPASAPELRAPVSKETVDVPVIADAATIIKRPEVPILCYHQLREFKPTDSKTAKDYIVPVTSFREQMKLLADSGYHSILPDQLYDYLAFGTPLPGKPVMITFDDTRLDHFTVALPELSRYGFKGVFFIMTVSLNRPGYMTRQQVKQLADEGHVVGLHTWNHKNVKTYTDEDWPVQVEKPMEELEKITGKPVDYFAYPFGLWNKQGLEKIKEYQFKAAFQLSGKREENLPLFCVRRIIIPGEWTTPAMQTHMKAFF